MSTMQFSQPVPFIYINSIDALESCITELAKAKVLALDLEFDRDHYTYGFDLCLMQIATSRNCYLVDPKLGVDASRIFPFFESESIQKIVHCSGEDLRLLHSLGCYPKNLVDTEVYAKLLNYERTSLSAILQQLFGLVLDKKLQKINWTLRPMSEEQMEYAANDVRYLISLKQQLEKEAEAKGLMAFVAEENELLSTTIHGSGIKENFLKKNDLRFLSPYDQYVLNEMFRYRDSLARNYNKPAHHIMPESTMRDLVFIPIKDQPPILERVHRSLKTGTGRNEFFQKLDDYRKLANDMNLAKKRIRNGNADSYENDRDGMEGKKALLFTPIQKAIAAKYGINSMRFILSSTLVSAILQQQIKITEIKTASRRQLIRETAAELQIDLSAYE